MKNLEIARMFYEMADILKIQKVEWKPRAYKNAGRALESLSEDVKDIYEKGGIKALIAIPGIGEGLAKKIIEFIETGKIRAYEKLKKEIPKGVSEMMEIPGIGPRKAYFLYKKLGIKSIDQLEEAARKNKISGLPGFKEKSEENILLGIRLARVGKERMLLGFALPIAEKAIERLKNVEGIDKIEAVGSLRRMKETIGDIDILVTAKDSNPVMDAFVSMPEVIQVIAKGPTKSMVILTGGIHTDIRVVRAKSFGSALQYFTGNKDHNIMLRMLAIRKGLKLSEYGLFKSNKQLAGKTEKGVYNALGLSWIPPEMREHTGEIEAAMKGEIPKLIDLKDIRGDFHCHTKWSDGSNTIEEMAKEAMKIGYQYICITDHSKTEQIAHGMDEERLLKQIAEIKVINKKIIEKNKENKIKKKFKILAGAEVDILKDGSLDYSDEILKQLDVVIAAVHSGFKSPKREMTERVLTALDNRYINMLSHPTGRRLNRRLPYEIDLEKVFEKAAQNKIAMEINAALDRLDLNGENAKKAIEMGVKLAIGTDTHNTNQLKNMKLGVGTARRGWATKKDIINTYPLKELLKFLEK